MMMLVLVVLYMAFVYGGIQFCNLVLLLAIFIVLRKPGLLLRGSFWDMHTIFSETPVCANVTAEGRPYLGAVIGSLSISYVSSKDASCVTELELLASFVVI